MTAPADAATKPELPGPLVSAGWLAEHRSQVAVVDVRWYLDGRSGLDAYRGGHIPGAVFADLDTDLSGPPNLTGGRHPLPSPEDFAAAMARLGIGDDTTVVAYDDAAGMVAGRLWWMLDSLGRRAAVLDGGMEAWTTPLETSEPAIAPAHFAPRPWPDDRFATADDAGATPTRGVLLDARSADRYEGAANAIDPRFGHIPGARSAPHADNVESGRLKSPDALRSQYERYDIDIGGETDVVAYCGSGVSACSDLLALRVAGHSRARLYVGSWSAWGAEETRPLATGTDPG